MPLIITLQNMHDVIMTSLVCHDILIYARSYSPVVLFHFSLIISKNKYNFHVTTLKPKLDLDLPRCVESIGLLSRLVYVYIKISDTGKLELSNNL